MNDERLFAQHPPGLTFCPSEPSGEARESISAWTSSMELANVDAPLALKVEQNPWPIRAADAIIRINMTHISPWSATETLFESGVRTLSAGAPLYLYGPYRRGGAQTAPSNAAFDASLHARNAAWGVRGSESGHRGRARDKEVLRSCNRRSFFAAAQKQRERTTIPMEPNSSIGITRQCR